MILLRRDKTLLIFTLFFFCQIIFAQKWEVVPLSLKVGTTLDAEENAILEIFPDIKGFESAQFYQLGENKYMAKIVYIDRTRPKSLKRYLTWRQFQRLRYRAGSHPEITEVMREQQRDMLAYLRVHNIMDDIPPNTYCKIRHSNGTLMTGTFIKYSGKTIVFQSPGKRIEFPITELESISYRPLIDDGNLTKKALSFVLGAVLGLGIAELWNVQSRPAVDLIWHYRFTGVTLGLMSGGEMFEAVSILTSPKKFIAFTPEEVAKIK